MKKGIWGINQKMIYIPIFMWTKHGSVLMGR